MSVPEIITAAQGMWAHIKPVWGIVPASFFAGAFTRLRTWISDIRPVKRMWGLRDAKNLTICMSASSDISTGQHTKPTTGVGQVKAFGYIVESISAAYDMQSQNVFLSNEPIPGRLNNDLILLGGSKHNALTERLMRKIEALNVVNQYDNVITWMKKVDGDKIDYVGESDGSKVIKDYGLIIKMKNPFANVSSNQTNIFLFAGCHTYGTIAAAKYFTENYVKENSFFKTLFQKKKENVFMVVKCDIYEKTPIAPELIERYEF